MMPHPPVKALSFDAAGTLIELAEPVGESYHRIAIQHGIESCPDSLDLAFKVVWRRTPPAFSANGPVRDPDEKSWWRRVVNEVFAESGANFSSDEDFNIFFEALYEHFESPGTWIAVSGVEDALTKITSRYPAIVLSNFDGRLRRILSDLNLIDFFETILLSCELGASKPDPRVFAAAQKHFNMPPEYILHIGDDPICDWEGASRAGFGSFRVGREQSTLNELLRQLSLA